MFLDASQIDSEGKIFRKYSGGGQGCGEWNLSYGVESGMFLDASQINTLKQRYSEIIAVKMEQ